MLKWYSVFMDLQRFIALREGNKCSPQVLEVSLMLYDENYKRIRSLVWAGDEGLRKLIYDFKMLHGETVIFTGPSYELDPQNYKQINLARELCENIGLKTGIVSYATELDISAGGWNYATVLIPALDIEGWHESMGGEPVPDKRWKWFYPWDHKNPSGRLVGRLVEADLADDPAYKEFCKKYDFNSIEIGPPDNSFPGAGFDVCRYQWLHTSVDARGDIRACPAAMETRALGNLGYSVFSELWPIHNTLSLQACPRYTEDGGCAYEFQNEILHRAARPSQ